MKTFGERVREARKAKGLSQQQLGKAIRSHKGYVSSIESGNVSPPSPKMLPVLCRKLGLPLEEMAALAWWQKRPKDVTLDAAFQLIDNLISESVQPTPPGEERADQVLMGKRSGKKEAV